VLPWLTHHFILSQGARRNDTRFITEHEDDDTAYKGVPTQHGFFLMRSGHEAAWAKQFERRGFVQATPGITQPPCYFYEPAGCVKWPSYPKGKHYRIDFCLVYDVENRVVYEDKKRAKYDVCSVALRWKWVSIKPTTAFAQDRQYLIDLVKFDSRHQTAFQCCGYPDHPLRIYEFAYNSSTGGVDVTER
jgi:hypothetical protein